MIHKKQIYQHGNPLFHVNFTNHHNVSIYIYIYIYTYIYGFPVLQHPIPSQFDKELERKKEVHSMTSLIQKQKSFNLFLEGNNLCQITNHFLQQINQYFDEQVIKPLRIRFSNGELHILDNK